MPAWVPVSIEDVRAEAAVARIEAAFATDLADILPHFDRIASGIVAEIRAAIGSNPANQLDSDTHSVPPEWVRYAALTILAGLLSRAGQGPDLPTYRLSEDQTKYLDRRTGDLERVAEGKLAVSLPDTAAAGPEVGSLAASLEITGNSRRWNRTATDGL